MSEWVDLRGEGELLARLNLHTLELAIMGRRGRLFCCDIVASVAAQRPVIERFRVSEDEKKKTLPGKVSMRD